MPKKISSFEEGFCLGCAKPADCIATIESLAKLPICKNVECKKTVREKYAPKRMEVMVVDCIRYREAERLIRENGFNCVISKTKQEAVESLEKNGEIRGVITASRILRDDETDSEEILGYLVAEKCFEMCIPCVIYTCDCQEDDKDLGTIPPGSEVEDKVPVVENNDFRKAIKILKDLMQKIA